MALFCYFNYLLLNHICKIFQHTGQNHRVLTMLVSVTGLLRQHHWLALNMAATMISTKDVGQQPKT